MTSIVLLLVLLLVGLGYFWLLVKIARPKPLAKPVKDSKGWLVAQTVLSWLCSFLFGFLTLWMLGVFVVTSGWGMATSGGLLATLGAPLLLAISVRWTRIVMRRWKALRRTPTVEEGRAG